MATMTIQHETLGTYTFPQEKIPLVSRRITAEKVHPQSGGHRRIDITLSGYFSGANHTAIMAQYESLISFCNGNRVLLTYHDGTNSILNNQPVYIETISDPSQWKQRLGDYTITGYYFATFDPSFSGLVSSFQSPAGTFSFPQLPVLQINKQRARDSARGWENLPSGAQIGAEVRLLVVGEICANSHADLLTLRSQLDTAASRDGTLNYGSMSFACHSQGVQWMPTVPLNYWPFQLELVYFITGLTKFNAEIDYPRITTDPVIHENPLCLNPPYVAHKNTSSQGQLVSYHFEAEGESLSTMRTLLLNEINALVYPNGIEIKGGHEHHNIQEPRITIDFQKYYYPPVLANLG